MLIGQLVPRDDDVAWSSGVNKNGGLEFGRSDIESALESFPNIDCLKDEQKKCIAALLQKKDALGLLPI